MLSHMAYMYRGTRTCIRQVVAYLRFHIPRVRVHSVSTRKRAARQPAVLLRTLSCAAMPDAIAHLACMPYVCLCGLCAIASPSVISTRVAWITSSLALWARELL